jgi:hypothetical protein
MSALCWGSRGVVGGGGGPPGDATVWPDVATDADLRASGLRTGDRQRTTTPDAEWVYSGTAWEIREANIATLGAGWELLSSHAAVADAVIRWGAEILTVTPALSLPGGGTRQFVVPRLGGTWACSAYLAGNEGSGARAAQGWTDNTTGGGTITGDVGGSGYTAMVCTGSGPFAWVTVAGLTVGASTRIVTGGEWRVETATGASGATLRTYQVGDGVRGVSVTAASAASSAIAFRDLTSLGNPPAGSHNVRDGGTAFPTGATPTGILTADIERDGRCEVIRDGAAYALARRGTSTGATTGSYATGGTAVIIGLNHPSGSSGTTDLRVRYLYVLTHTP